MNEFDFIQRLREQLQSRKSSPRLIKGVGDDAALIAEAAGRDLVVSTDMVVEGIDFHRDSTSARLLGHRALAVSLSDIAAMGARPLWGLTSLAVPTEIWKRGFADEFFAGYLALADQYGVTLSGGDLSATPDRVTIDSIVIGEVTGGKAVLRSGAEPGDQILVTGTLGGAAAGLKLIEMGARLDSEGVRSPTVKEGSDEHAHDGSIESLLLRQLRPSPRVGWGIVLGEEKLASAMIDISDGLSSDLAHLCRESHTGALIQSDSLPIDADVTRLCGRRALDPLALALHGGEDFELLFTVRPDNVARLPKRVDGVTITRIGEVTNEPNVVRLAEKNRVWDLQPQGYEHFKRPV